MRPLREGNYASGLKALCCVLPSNLIMAEIGSYAGESSEIFVNSGKVKELHCIDTWEYSHEYEQDVESLFDGFRNTYSSIVKKHKGLSENKCKQFADHYFDFVYIDADHSYDSVKRDIYNYLPKVKSNGIVAGHDFHLDDVKRAVTETFGKPHNVFKDNSWIVFLNKL